MKVYENLSESEIDGYIENIVDVKDNMWCDANENLLNGR